MIDVLVFSRTAGFRHVSIGEAHRFFNGLSPEEGIRAAITEDPSFFNDDFLARFEVVAFVNTTGDVLDAAQQAAMERFIRSGRGYVGVHSAADTEYGWEWYGRLVGAYFRSHPLLPVEVEVTTEEDTHPSTAHLEPTFTFIDEIYNFDRNPRRDNVILLTVDEEGFIYPNTDGGPSMGADHPVAWYKEFEGGRSFYTNLGHQQQTWSEALFQRHLLEGVRWAAQPVTYSRVVLTRNAANPLALAAAPDGRVFYIERTGEVRVWLPDSGRVVEAAALDVSLEGENGLLGIALDPAFADNGWIYLYYSLPDAEPLPDTSPRGTNTLSRFTVDAGSIIDPGSRVELLQVPSDRINHEGGALAFGTDGTLFLSVGDNTNPFDANGSTPIDDRPGRELYDAQRTAGNPFDLRGKILRINPDGTIPAGNLFAADGGAGRPEVFVMGTRNPFRIAVDPLNGRLFWGDVGPDALGDSGRGPRGYDEINFADAPGQYGWPYCIADNLAYADFDFETNRPGPRFSCDGRVPALLAYDYLTVSHLALGNALDPEAQIDPDLGIALTGRTAIAGAFYRRPPGEPAFALPSPYADTLLMTEWTRDLLVSIEVDENGALGKVRRFLPWENFRRPIDLDVGPDGALYVLEYGTGFSGDNDDAQLTRIEHSAAGELSPAAAARAMPAHGSLPLTVSFSAEGSRAAGTSGAIVGYEWDVDGDGAIDSREPSFAHTYESGGVYSAALVVVTESGRRSVPSTVEIIAGNSAPRVTIVEPAAGTVLTPGAATQLVGAVEDDEDGEIDCNELLWDVRLGHNSHSHPEALLRGCSVPLRPALASHGTVSGVFYFIDLRYTDHGGPGVAPPLTGRATLRLEVAR
jgi:glucose/arabinose dehydrogenase